MYGALLFAWIGLLALLSGSVAIATNTALAQGPVAISLNIGCAIVMAAIVFSVFMRLRYADGLLRVLAVGGVMWVAFLLVLALADVLTR